MSPTKKEEVTEDIAELREDVDEIERDTAEPQSEPLPEARSIVIEVEIETSTNDPDVTEEQVLLAAEEQIVLPNSLWINKSPSGQIAVTVVGVKRHDEPDPPVE